ncbi:MAG: pantoate--beta-alanine ligase [Gammaproteobacteria bacterium]
MQTETTVAELRKQITAWKNQGNRIVLVPTMGNLHDGHLALMQHAHECGDKVVCSIFVNALQFDRTEDLHAYPRTLKQDLAALQAEHVDLVFMPEHDEVYAEAHRPQKEIIKHSLNDQLCGKFRPGFFDGIVEVVARLFHIVTPDVAVFGEKDFQQLTIIKRLVEDMGFPIHIAQVPTQREEDGLAYSSRNSYLSLDERAQATQIYETLLYVKAQIKSESQSFNDIEKQAMERLSQVGFRPDYVTIRDAKSFKPASYSTDSIVVLVAAWLGKARLIDNLLLQTR